MMNNITADHLARRACVYVRQSTPGQVQNNLESQRRQYALVDRARSLGCQDIDVIDDDLGVSGSGTRRVGFERLLRALCVVPSYYLRYFYAHDEVVRELRERDPLVALRRGLAPCAAEAVDDRGRHDRIGRTLQQGIRGAGC